MHLPGWLSFFQFHYILFPPIFINFLQINTWPTKKNFNLHPLFIILLAKCEIRSFPFIWLQAMSHQSAIKRSWSANVWIARVLRIIKNSLKKSFDIICSSFAKKPGKFYGNSNSQSQQKENKIFIWYIVFFIKHRSWLSL